MKQKHIVFFLYSSMILIASYFIYFRDYHVPEDAVWDEIYTISSAYSYINGEARVELHPPLGLAFIALGEILLQPNSTVDTQGLSKALDIGAIPKGFSFRGVRFFPALMGSLCPLLFFILLYLSVPNTHFAGLFSSLYLFDNALIVQSRVASLEGMQLFFILMGLSCFVYIVTRQKFSKAAYVCLGLLIGLAVIIKVNSAILLLLPIAAGAIQCAAGCGSKKAVARASTAVITAAAVMFSAILTMYILAAPFQNKQPPGAKRYLNPIGSMNPTEYSRLLKVMPRKDAKSSNPLSWPLGHKSIKYLSSTDMATSRFVYFQGNPAAWWVGFVAIVMGIALVIARSIFGLDAHPKHIFLLIQTYVLIYVVYIITLAFVERVLYLTHYLIPLVISFVVAYLLFYYIFCKQVASNNKVLYCAVAFYVVQLFAVYVFFSPLSYYHELSRRDFNRRTWSSLWELNYDQEP